MLRILVVCTANICRSPMGEHLLRQRLKGMTVEVDSAGVSGQHGIEADPVVQKMLIEKGISEIEKHKSKPIVSGMSGQYDLFLCMESHHLSDIQQIMPSITGRAYLFGHWTSEEIPDPHNMEEPHYRLAYETIANASRHWQEKLPLLGLI